MNRAFASITVVDALITDILLFSTCFLFRRARYQIPSVVPYLLHCTVLLLPFGYSLHRQLSRYLLPFHRLPLCFAAVPYLQHCIFLSGMDHWTNDVHCAPPASGQCIGSGLGLSSCFSIFFVLAEPRDRTGWGGASGRGRMESGLIAMHLHSHAFEVIVGRSVCYVDRCLPELVYLI